MGVLTQTYDTSDAATAPTSTLGGRVAVSDRDGPDWDARPRVDEPGGGHRSRAAVRAHPAGRVPAGRAAETARTRRQLNRGRHLADVWGRGREGPAGRGRAAAVRRPDPRARRAARRRRRHRCRRRGQRAVPNLGTGPRPGRDPSQQRPRHRRRRPASHHRRGPTAGRPAAGRTDRAHHRRHRIRAAQLRQPHRARQRPTPQRRRPARRRRPRLRRAVPATRQLGTARRPDEPHPRHRPVHRRAAQDPGLADHPTRRRRPSRASLGLPRPLRRPHPRSADLAHPDHRHTGRAALRRRRPPQQHRQRRRRPRCRPGRCRPGSRCR